MAEQRLQNRYLQNGGDNMRDVKMGLTIEEAAEMSGIGRNTMRKLVDWGKLPVLKVGRKTIIRRDTLENFMTVNQGRNLLNQADVREVR
jgi:excisionase family DNA binding protein